ncbi:hypothetical protein BNATCHR2114 (nucleomorph) [Bigelowiella natans]|uniref:Uncharacterized protein n=1 Tax=Bigelowiella natans TaxID=227086 RepID=Q3LW32_BIGNA|nr:hypothetical protein BNATCHR2114 [Bigelowiella natans]ABA27333.1 hypothetical protein [Bigelowiella natans]
MKNIIFIIWHLVILYLDNFTNKTIIKKCFYESIRTLDILNNKLYLTISFNLTYKIWKLISYSTDIKLISNIINPNRGLIMTRFNKLFRFLNKENTLIVLDYKNKLRILKDYNFNFCQFKLQIKYFKVRKNKLLKKMMRIVISSCALCYSTQHNYHRVSFLFGKIPILFFINSSYNDVFFTLLKQSKTIISKKKLFYGCLHYSKSRNFLFLCNNNLEILKFNCQSYTFSGRFISKNILNKLKNTTLPISLESDHRDQSLYSIHFDKMIIIWNIENYECRIILKINSSLTFGSITTRRKSLNIALENTSVLELKQYKMLLFNFSDIDIIIGIKYLSSMKIIVIFSIDETVKIYSFRGFFLLELYKEVNFYNNFFSWHTDVIKKCFIKKVTHVCNNNFESVKKKNYQNISFISKENKKHYSFFENYLMKLFQFRVYKSDFLNLFNKRFIKSILIFKVNLNSNESVFNLLFGIHSAKKFINEKRFLYINQKNIDYTKKLLSILIINKNIFIKNYIKEIYSMIKVSQSVTIKKIKLFLIYTLFNIKKNSNLIEIMILFMSINCYIKTIIKNNTLITYIWNTVKKLLNEKIHFVIGKLLLLKCTIN